MSDNEMEVEELDEEAGDEGEPDAAQEESKPEEVYLPGMPLADDEELVCDNTVYVMLHQAQTGAPCLSFDVIEDCPGESCDFPLTTYIVSGTQASQAHLNNVIVMKLSNLHKMNAGEDSDDESDEEEEEDEDESKDPKMSGALIRHQGCVNRIRCKRIGGAVLAASWSELGRVNVWNLSEQLNVVEDDNLLKRYRSENRSDQVKPAFSFAGHQREGFALDWSPTVPGALATGDCRKDIHIWQPTDGGSWTIDQRPLIGHEASVEDIQWSPGERSVFASCSTDKSVRIWDVRSPPSKACKLSVENAHTSDVNVISWNRNEMFVVSGGDDGRLHVWDLRVFGEGKPIGTFKHHIAPVTTVEWHPTESAVFASGGADNQIALWDLSVEKDSEDDVEGVPPQLLFIHQGQLNIKELHWYKRVPGVILSTAESGFNIFKTISV